MPEASRWTLTGLWERDVRMVSEYIVETANGSMESKKQLETQENVLAIMSGPISDIVALNREAIETPEYRYGLLVMGPGIAVSDNWARSGNLEGIRVGRAQGGWDRTAEV